MKKGNVIDLADYQSEPQSPSPTGKIATISEELINAIQSLIHRLREVGPISQSN